MNSIHTLQVLRGVAAWMVVFHHYMEILHDFKFSGFLGQFFVSQGAFGVDLFFVLSGFVMCYTMAKHNYGAYAFIANRVVRIVPVYWFYTLLLILLASVFTSGFTFVKTRLFINRLDE